MMRKAIETASGLTFAKEAALATKLFTKAFAAAASPVERKETAAGVTVTEATTMDALGGCAIRGDWNSAAVSSNMRATPNIALASVRLKARNRTCDATAAI